MRPRPASRAATIPSSGRTSKTGRKRSRSGRPSTSHHEKGSLYAVAIVVLQSVLMVEQRSKGPMATTLPHALHDREPHDRDTHNDRAQQRRRRNARPQPRAWGENRRNTPRVKPQSADVNHPNGVSKISGRDQGLENQPGHNSANASGWPRQWTAGATPSTPALPARRHRTRRAAHPSLLPDRGSEGLRKACPSGRPSWGPGVGAPDAAAARWAHAPSLGLSRQSCRVRALRSRHPVALTS